MEVKFYGRSLENWKEYVKEDLIQNNVVFKYVTNRQQYTYGYVSDRTGHVVKFEFQFGDCSICNPDFYILKDSSYRHNSGEVSRKVENFIESEKSHAQIVYGSVK